MERVEIPDESGLERGSADDFLDGMASRVHFARSRRPCWVAALLLFLHLSLVTSACRSGGGVDDSTTPYPSVEPDSPTPEEASPTPDANGSSPTGSSPTPVADTPDPVGGSPGSSTPALTPDGASPTPAPDTATPDDVTPTSTPHTFAPDDASPTLLPTSPSPFDPDPTPPVETIPPAEEPSETPVHSAPSPSPNEEPSETPIGPAPSPTPDEEPEEITDILIVGGGPAGMAAAIEVEKSGQDFLVLEMDIETGGAARWSAGLMLIAGTSTQADRGIVDSPETLLGEWESMTGGDPELPWVQSWAYDGPAEVHDWLLSIGLEFENVGWTYDSGDVARIHQPLGGGLELISRLALSFDESTLRVNHQVTSLVTSGAKVIGARYTDLTTGSSAWIQSSAVIMATGGFLRDLDRVLASRPELEDIELWFATGPNSSGDGHDMLETVGATTTNSGAIGVYAHSISDYRHPEDHEELGVEGLEYTLIVNAEAERFANEALSFSFSLAEDLLGQPEGLAWAIFDQDVYERLALSDFMAEATEPVEAPSLSEAIHTDPEHVQADTIDELAQAIGLDPSALAVTLADYEAIKNTGQDPYGKSADRVDVMDHPPYYALRIVPSLAKAFGGISVATDGSVLDQAEQPIEGLFAAGELSGMAGGTLIGDMPFTGSLSPVIYSGRVAAWGAVNYLSRVE